MTLLVHTGVSVIIGQYAGNPISAFFYGILSHILLDLIPHGDNNTYHRYKNKELSMKKAMAALAIDAIAAIVFVLFFFNLDISKSNLITSMAIIGGIIPDVIVGIYELLDPKSPRWLRAIHRLHFKNHNLIAKRFDFSRKNGLILQILAFLICLKIL